MVAVAPLRIFRINVNDPRLGIESSSGRAALVLLIRTAKLAHYQRRSRGEDDGHQHSEHEDQSVRQAIPLFQLLFDRTVLVSRKRFETAQVTLCFLLDLTAFGSGYAA